MEIEEKRAKNVKLYPIYKMFSWDLLFYYAISFLFYTQVKGFSASVVLLADGFYPLFKLIFQIPCVSFVDSYGKRKAIILGNMFVTSGILTVLLCNSVPLLILANLFFAIGYNFKGLCESSVLYDSLEGVEKRRDVFSKLDGRGSSFYYYIDAISAASTGFLFIINGYLPMILCFVFCCISIFISFNFHETHEENFAAKRKISELKVFLKDFRYIQKNIFKSNRLKCLLLFSGLFHALISVLVTLRSSLLTDLHVPEEYFGIIAAVMGILSGIASKKQNWFHKKYKNKVLTYFSLPLSMFLIVLGLLMIAKLNIYITLVFIGLYFTLYSLIKGPYYTLIKRYLNSFTTPTVNTKVYSANTVVESIFKTITCFFSSYLLSITTTSYTLIILGCIFTIVFIILLDYMRLRVRIKTRRI